ncbi:DUF4097 family beta strand repeat-containing protein [Paenibacillus lignilyticus]|uniref:DUF4097 family beta strand repeat protein n=1 Tax=Paenibacillus lignilyticus TaxID=1172615 RepID=A0ABS5CHY8_9BACL|nr:DUF4097 family beta strand repeat-containing protein [Paenibacillus lignilyticus]MBP3965465.1 DUF4097 family beta strand repeat protein [Paenibacillus lignilyticus]
MRESSRSTLLASLLAFLVPGGGHLALGRHLTGMLLLLGTLTDIAAMIRFADEGGGKYALLIIFLGLALPFFWFYSVFDTLQLAAKQREAATSSAVEESPRLGIGTIVQAIAVIGLAFLLLVFVQAPVVFQSIVDTIGTYAPGIGFIILAIVFASRRNSAMFKLGRFTAAAVMITVGALLLWDQVRDRNDMELIGRWWPAAFVLLGIEVVIMSLVYRTASKRPSFDLGGTFLAALIAVTAFGVTQFASMPFRWLDEFKVNLTGTSAYGEEKGFRYAKEIIHAPITYDTRVIEIVNPNGKVTVKKGNVSELTVESVMWVDAAEQTEADDTASKSEITVSGEDELKIEAKGHPYGANGDRVPRMNIVVTVPAESAFGKLIPVETTNPAESTGTDESADDSHANTSELTDQTPAVDESTGAGQSENDSTSPQIAYLQSEIAIQIVNGSVDVTGLSLPGGLSIKATTGSIALHGLTGSVKAETKNGGIDVSTLTGDAKLSTYNGDVKAGYVTGAIEASTLSGSINLQQVTGDIDTDTKNGEIVIKEGTGAIKADTLNGDIRIASSQVGGDWDIDSSIGEITVSLPLYGNYSVNGSATFGEVSSDLPLTISKKTIRGSIGTANYRINIDANSSIQVNRYK